VEPHKVNPPRRWWHRIVALDYARSQLRARETVERIGLSKSDKDTRKLYNDLMLTLRGDK
jgi:hypothetical protein